MNLCSNGKPFIIATRSTVLSELGDDWTPCVALLTAWTKNSASISFWSELIKLLLDKGTTYFVCIGTHSEKLHDEIDDLLYQYDDELRLERSINIVTTYHANDTIEEAVDYCVYATEFRDKDNNFILAILDDNSIEDGKVKGILEQA